MNTTQQNAVKSDTATKEKTDNTEIEIIAVGDEALIEEREQAEKERKLNAVIQQSIKDAQIKANAEQSKTAQEIINGLNPVSYSKIKRAVSVTATRGEVVKGEYRDLKTGRPL